MDYNKIAEQAVIKENVRLQEDKYCEQVLDMLSLLGEDEAVEFIKSLPSHLQETTLKKQATQMYSKVEQILNDVVRIKKHLAKANTINKNSPKYISQKDKNTILEKIKHIEGLAEKTKSILDNSEFKKWCKDVDGNSNIFGGKKLGATGPSRRELGV